MNNEENKYEVLEPLHRALVMMLEDFAGICEREGVAWYASYGTAIGALREGGFIPWDEDIDICLARRDLDRVIEVVKRDWSDKYEMINAQINPNYPMATSRMMLKGTICADESLASMDFESGIFLDLFPLDALADDEKLYARQLRRAWVYNKLAIAKLTPSPYIKGDGIRSKILRCGCTVANRVLNLPGVRSIDWNRKSAAESSRYEGLRTRRIGFVCDTTPTMDVYERADFEPARWVKFENVVIPVAAQVEKHLEELYGDWRTPVAESERDEHFPDILDLGPYAAQFGSDK